MESQIERAELQATRKIFVATPMYAGQCSGQYTKSTSGLASIAGKEGLDFEFFYLFNESLITRARNYCVDEFLRNEKYTHLMFIDADIGFDPNDVIHLAIIADPGKPWIVRLKGDNDYENGTIKIEDRDFDLAAIETDDWKMEIEADEIDRWQALITYKKPADVFNIIPPVGYQIEVVQKGYDNDKDIICGPYPKKTISWEKIKMAVDKGYADENPQNLKNYVGDFVFNPASNQREIRLDEPVEVLEGGTGFMMIKREVFTKFAAAYPDLRYKPDHIRTTHFDGSRHIHAYFETVIDPETERYLSEDYMFCQYARKIGIKVWLCPWMHLVHMGSYFFSGSLPHLAQIGASATADPTQKLK